MAKKKDGGESKTGLILSLIFFVLTTIILGVLAYAGFSGQAELQEIASQARKKETAEKNLKEAQLAQLLALRIALGINAKEDQENLVNMLQQPANKEALDAEVANLNRAFQDRGIVWDPALNKPRKTALEAIDDAVTTQRKAEQDLAKALKDAEQTKQELEEAVAKADDRAKRFQAQAAKSEAEKAEVQKQKAQQYLDAVAKIDELGQDIAGLKKDRADFEATVKKDKAKLNTKIDDLTLAKQRLEAKLPQVNLLDYDKPKGSIVNIDRRSNLVDIDLGYADNIRPQVTFSIKSPDVVGKGAASRERKAAIEVVRVLGPHLSVAKFTDPGNPTRDPVMRGDLLYNPAWNPNLKEHVALAGIIDLNGDGQDDTFDFIKALEKQGVVVDTYLDLNDLTMKGPGLSDKTSYLILGDTPDLSDSGTGGLTDNKRDVRLREVIEKISQARQQAKELGIQPIAARRFIAMIGFEVPKTTVAPDYISGKYLRERRAESAPPAEAQVPDAGR
jgi:hypothetical protein